MNILHIDEQRGWRGGEQQASYLIAGLTARGHNVAIAGRARSPFLQAEHGGGPITRVAAPLGIELDLWSAQKLSILVRDQKIDIIHAHTSHAHTLAHLTRKLAGRGKVLVSRRVDFKPKSGILNRWKYNAPDHYIAISKCIEQVLLDYGLPKNKVSCVHSGVDPTRFQVPPLPRVELGLPEEAVLIGTVGALVGHKDHKTLIESIPAVLKGIPNAHFVIAGDGPLRQDLQSQIAQLRIEKNVHLLGYRSDIPNLLRSLDFFVMPSKEEGLGTSVLDAMICELPVVATDGGGLSEMVHHEETGLLVPPQNPWQFSEALLRIAQDPQLAERLAQGGHRLATERFSVETMIEGNIAVYKKLREKS